MIGMMNIGQQEGVEFYGSARQNSIFDNRKISKAKDVLGYTPDGRVTLNGVVVLTETPEDLWQSVIHKAVAKNMVDHVVDKPSKIATILRRLSSKLSSFSKIKQEKSKEEDVVELADEDDAFHITRIRIHTQAPQKKNPQKIEDQRLYERMLQDRPNIERNQWNTSSKGTDSGRASLEEHSPIETKHNLVIAVDR